MFKEIRIKITTSVVWVYSRQTHYRKNIEFKGSLSSYNWPGTCKYKN